MLVGTQITGTSTNPVITEGRTPSIPAIVIITFDSNSSWSLSKSLWIPATPTSVIWFALHPINLHVAIASRAIGISPVPAVTTVIPGINFFLGFLSTIMYFPSSLKVASWILFFKNVNVSLFVLVINTRSSDSSILSAIEVIWSGVLFIPNITSGAPFLSVLCVSIFANSKSW